MECDEKYLDDLGIDTTNLSLTQKFEIMHLICACGLVENPTRFLNDDCPIHEKMIHLPPQIRIDLAAKLHRRALLHRHETEENPIPAIHQPRRVTEWQKYLRRNLTSPYPFSWSERSYVRPNSVEETPKIKPVKVEKPEEKPTEPEREPTRWDVIEL